VERHLLDLLLASNDIECLGVAHDVDATHISSNFATDGALTDLILSNDL
jgi:hypothetical protein